MCVRSPARKYVTNYAAAADAVFKILLNMKSCFCCAFSCFYCCTSEIAVNANFALYKRQPIGQCILHVGVVCG